MEPTAETLLEEVVFGNAQGGRKPARQVHIAVERELTEEDLPMLERAAQIPAAPQQTILAVKHAHHQLAQMIAKGYEMGQVSLITGYAPAYISVLKTDPTFKELLAYYATQREQIFIDTVERMKALGLSTLDELQERLMKDPGGWSKRELMDMTELMLVKPMAAAKAGAGSMTGSAPVTVNVKFVTAPEQEPRPMLDLGAGEFQHED